MHKLQRMNLFISFIMDCFIGAFFGYGIYVYLQYRGEPELFAAQSAPWYSSIIVDGIITLIMMTVCIISKVIIRRKMKSASEEK